MTRAVAVGQDDVSLIIRLLDDTDGTPIESALPSPGPTIWYRREAAAVVTDVGSSELTALTTAHTDNEWKHIRDGYHRVDFPDAAFASGAGGVLCGMDATGISGIAEYINIDSSIKFQGKVDAATATTTTFVTGINPYQGDLIYVIDGTGAGQTRLIASVAPENSPDTGVIASHAAWTVNISATTSTVLLVPGDETLGDGGINVDVILSTRSTLSATQVNAEVDTALGDIYLDQLFAVDYDASAKPGIATALLNDLVEDDAGTTRYTANALEQAGGGATAQAVWDEVLDSAHSVVGSAAEKVKIIAGSDGTTLATAQGNYAPSKAGDAMDLVANAVDATAIATDAIDADAIATNAIGADAIAANAIGSSELATDAIGAAQIAANAIGASELAVNAIGSDQLANSAVDEIWQTVLTEGYAALSAEGTASQILYTIQQFMTDSDVAGTVYTIRQLDGSSSAYVLTLDNATTPTDKNRTS